jgi:hypothetical protein
MPDKAEHLQAAADHADFLRWRLDADERVDRPWIVTAIFYTALQLVDAWFATQGRHPGNHIQRNKWVATDPHLAPIWPHYEFLYDRSRDARYGLIAFSKTDVQAMHTQQLEPIRRHIQGILPP